MTFPEMSLSSSRAVMHPHQYELHIPQMELIQAMSIEYESWVTESKLDDEQCGGPQDELAEALYPPLDQVTENPNLAALVIGGYLRTQVFGQFCAHPSSTTVYWGDSVDSCILRAGMLLLRGACYSR